MGNVLLIGGSNAGWKEVEQGATEILLQAHQRGFQRDVKDLGKEKYVAQEISSSDGSVHRVFVAEGEDAVALLIERYGRYANSP